MYEPWELGVIDEAGYNGITDEHIERVAESLVHSGLTDIDYATFAHHCRLCNVDPDLFDASDLERLQEMLNEYCCNINESMNENDTKDKQHHSLSDRDADDSSNQSIEMADLVQKIFRYFQDGDKCLTADDVVDELQLPKNQVEEALEHLVERNAMYSIKSIVGTMYGIDSSEDCSSHMVSIDLSDEDSGSGFAILKGALSEMDEEEDAQEHPLANVGELKEKIIQYFADGNKYLAKDTGAELLGLDEEQVERVLDHLVDEGTLHYGESVVGGAYLLNTSNDEVMHKLRATAYQRNEKLPDDWITLAEMLKLTPSDFIEKLLPIDDATYLRDEMDQMQMGYWLQNVAYTFEAHNLLKNKILQRVYNQCQNTLMNYSDKEILTYELIVLADEYVKLLKEIIHVLEICNTWKFNNEESRNNLTSYLQECFNQSEYDIVIEFEEDEDERIAVPIPDIVLLQEKFERLIVKLSGEKPVEDDNDDELVQVDDKELEEYIPNPEATKKMLHMLADKEYEGKQADRDFEHFSKNPEKRYRGVLFLANKEGTILDAGKVVCEKLHHCCEALIISLDESCKLLLAENPDASAIGEVSKLIDWLCEEMEITMNVDGEGYLQYKPTEECKTIANNWKETFHAIKARQKTPIHEEALADYKKEVEQADRAIYEPVRDECWARIEAYELALEQEIHQQVESYKAEVDALEKERDEIEKRLGELKFYQILERSELKEKSEKLREEYWEKHSIAFDKKSIASKILRALEKVRNDYPVGNRERYGIFDYRDAVEKYLRNRFNYKDSSSKWRSYQENPEQRDQPIPEPTKEAKEVVHELLEKK